MMGSNILQKLFSLPAILAKKFSNFKGYMDIWQIFEDTSFVWENIGLKMNIWRVGCKKIQYLEKKPQYYLCGTQHVKV